jgi:serine/threonine protein kinase
MFRSGDDEMFKNAEREFKILKTLRGHPNIVQGIDYIPEKHRGRGFLVMERVYGVSILNFVLQYGPLRDEELAKKILNPILSAVDYMHSKGVVHRDMNPTNVFIHFLGIDS